MTKTQNPDPRTIVAIWTDGLGTYQPRCTQCDWVGRWTRTEDKAVAEGRTHAHGPRT